MAVPVSHLNLSDEQWTTIIKTYQNPNSPSITDIHFDHNNQAEAHQLLLAHKLDPESLDQPANKWSAQWSNGPKETFKHILLQCILMDKLTSGARLTEIQDKNRAMVAARQYREQTESLGRYRYLLRRYNTASLYAQYYRTQGINIKEKAHLNIHNWLDPKSKAYHPTLARAIFHYTARTSKTTRLEVCIATDEMKEAAWRYGHLQQILLDGTFGVCDRRLPLFIVMGIDEQFHGVPLAFLLFLAPGGNEATHGGYNIPILVKMLLRWKDSVTLYRQREFKPAVAITDTDVKERGALVTVFPDIKLLLCRFHLRQRWANSRKKCLRSKLPDHKVVLDRLVVLERRLVESMDFDTAQALVNEEISALNRLAANSIYASAAGKGLAHLGYLSSYWVTEALWECWSNSGRCAAAAVIGVAVHEVVMTNNHLESFNGLLKHKMLKGWSRGGRRIRVDILVFMLALKIAQSIFQKRRLEEEERKMLQKALEGVPGADALMRTGRNEHRPIEAPVAYLIPDTRRDDEARLLMQQNRLSKPAIHEKAHTPNIEIPTNKAAAMEAIASRYSAGGRNIAQNAVARIDLGPGEVAGAFEQAARCVNEALQGGFLGDLDNIDEFNDKDMSNSEGEGYEEEDMSSGDDLELWSSDDESRLPSNSARGVAEQVIARTTYDIKRQMKVVPTIHAALDQITQRDLENSRHRLTYAKYADELEALAARVRGLLLLTTHHTSSQTNSQPPTQTQHDTSAIPIPPSPEKRQNRMESHSIH
ncbi:hypothetical protein FRC11_008513 [Ceratobasidium sp. 423]|nr:hypothetical protein FRC11_008513 [Ceratobasidium sp. 423]